MTSTIVSYLLIEAFFFRFIFPNAQPSIQPHLHETPGALSQITKAEFAPHNYVAILGNSMAEGLGDTLLAAGNNVAHAFHAANVVHDLTGRDVVSFGRGGAGSAEGLVRQPARIMGGSRCLFFPTMEEPSRIFAYFYEGNDIQDNLRFTAMVARKYGRADRQTIDTYLNDQYADFPMWRCHLYLFDIASRMVTILYKHHYLGIDKMSSRTGDNILLVAGKQVHGPAPLEAPALEVNDADINIGIEVFARSLAWLKARFPRTQITVVYVPSALSIYRLAGTSYIYSVQPPEDGRTGRASIGQIESSSDQICSLVRDASARLGVGFFNTRSGLRRAAAERLLHGPTDWVHFNKDGYRTLGTLLTNRMDDWARINSCPDLLHETEIQRISSGAAEPRKSGN